MAPSDRIARHEETHPVRGAGAIDISAAARALKRGPSISLANVIDGARLTVNLARMTRFDDPHVHLEHDEILYFLEGNGQFEMAGKTYDVGTGDLVYVPAGVLHTPVVRRHALVLTVFGPRLDAPDRIVVHEDPES